MTAPARPALVALVGLPGAGKSQLAQAIARVKQWPIVSRDAFARPRFDDAGKAAATDAALAAAARHLAGGESCILDGMTLSSSQQRDRVREAARRTGAELVMVWLDCPVDVAIARIAAQADHPAADRNAALVREVAARFEMPESEVTRLDAKLQTPLLLQRVLELL